MKEVVNICESEINFEEYFKAENISDDTKEKLEQVDILVVPARYAENEYYFAQETIEFIKFCREREDKYKIDILADGDIKIRSLHSFDIWMPIIEVLSDVAFNIAIGLVANYIYDKLKGREHECAQVDVTFVVKNGKNSKELHYRGDAKTFKENFEKIDLNKM